METSTKGRGACIVLAVASVLYLASGIVNIVAGTVVVPDVLAALYAACLVMALGALLAIFFLSPKAFRALAAWSLVPAVFVVGTGAWRAAFPGMLSFPLTIYADFGGDRVFIGANMVPLALLVAVLVCSGRIIKRSPPSQSEQQGDPA